MAGREVLVVQHLTYRDFLMVVSWSMILATVSTMPEIRKNVVPF